MQEIALNGPLVEQAQAILAEMPIAQRVYNGILHTAEAEAVPQFRLTDIGGPNLEKAFVRSSGKPLNEGIEGIFTYDGFANVFKDQALSVAETDPARQLGAWAPRSRPTSPRPPLPPSPAMCWTCITTTSSPAMNSCWAISTWCR